MSRHAALRAHVIVTAVRRRTGFRCIGGPLLAVARRHSDRGATRREQQDAEAVQAGELPRSAYCL